jgi:hypothetical protein
MDGTVLEKERHLPFTKMIVPGAHTSALAVFGFCFQNGAVVSLTVSRGPFVVLLQGMRSSVRRSGASMAGYRITPVLVFWTLRLWTGFELPSSCITPPCYASNLNRNSLDFMSWHQIDLGAQDINDIQRPKSFQKNSWK